MAVSYGSEAGGSGNYEKMGIEFTYQYYTGVLSGGNPTGSLQSGLDSNTKSCKVTAHLWVWTKYRFEDLQVCTYSSGWVTASTWSGTISTPSNSSYSTSNKQNIRNCTKSYNLSTSGTTPCSMTATMSGLYCSSSARPTKTLSVSLPAIPSAGYPTMGDGTYNFGNLTEMYSLSLANGNANCVVVSVSVDLKKADGTTTSGIVSTADRLASCAVTTGSLAIGFTDAERTAILGYWENVSTGDATLPHDTTPLSVTVGFSISGGATSYFSMNITPPLIAALYNVSDPGLNVERANVTGSVSSDQLATFTIAADADSPWYQLDSWPTTLLLAWLSIAGAAEVSMPRSAISTSSISYYAYTDTTDLNLASTRAYAARLKSNGVQIPEAVDTTFTIQAIKSALKIYKHPTDANDKRVGVNLDVDPASTLHVGGIFTADSHLYEGVYLSADQTDPQGSGVAVVKFASNSYRFLTSGTTTPATGFSLVSNRLVVTVAGWYALYARIGYSASNTGEYRRIELCKYTAAGVSSVLAISHIPVVAGMATSNMYLACSAFVRLEAGDAVFINSGISTGSSALRGAAAPNTYATGVEVHRMF